MKNVLILCAHRPKRSPSQRYRFEQYLPFLEQQGFKFTFSYLLNEKDEAHLQLVYLLLARAITNINYSR